MEPYHREDPGPDVIGDDRIGPLTALAQEISQRIRQRLRRPSRAVFLAAGLAVVVVAAAVAVPVITASGPALQPARAGGVFASGTVDGRPWRLAVQDIADPGYRCLPAITLNGIDADPVYPLAGSGGAVTLGRAAPGVGFGFVELPAGSGGVTVGGRHVPAVRATACGYSYQLTGFTYRLPETLLVRLDNQPGVATVTLPQLTIQPTPAAADTDGLWLNTGTIPGPAAWQTLAQGELSGLPWSIQVQFGADGDCYQFSSPGRAQVGACGPVSTPDGPETLMALPFSLPGLAAGTTGYAVQVSPRTARLKAVFSGGSATVATPQLVAGRKYAAFVVPPSRDLDRLVWLDAAGHVIASTAAVPPYGYVQFQP